MSGYTQLRACPCHCAWSHSLRYALCSIQDNGLTKQWADAYHPSPQFTLQWSHPGRLCQPPRACPGRGPTSGRAPARSGRRRGPAWPAHPRRIPPGVKGVPSPWPPRPGSAPAPSLQSASGRVEGRVWRHTQGRRAVPGPRDPRDLSPDLRRRVGRGRQPLAGRCAVGCRHSLRWVQTPSSFQTAAWRPEDEEPERSQHQPDNHAPS